MRDVQDDVLGLGPLQRLLDDPSISEIMVNGPHTVYVERNGRLSLSDTRFTSGTTSAASLNELWARWAAGSMSPRPWSTPDWPTAPV